MVSVSIVQHGIQVDGSSLQKDGNTVSVKDDGITTAKLNADIVGIETATGKVNTINTTNFKSLDAVNLTNTGDLVKIETIDMTGGAGTTMNSSTLNLSAYKGVLVQWRGEASAGAQDVLLRFNADSGGNYQEGDAHLDADTHASTTSATDILVGSLDASWGGGMIMIETGSTKFTTVSAIGGYHVSNVCHGVYSSTDAITQISLIMSANNFATTSEMTIYGIK